MRWSFLLLMATVTAVSVMGQNLDRRAVIQESLESRYRVTVLGGGPLGIRGGDNAIRRVGGIVVVEQDGFFAAFDRRRLSSNAIGDGKTSVVSGDKDVPIAVGERFYVTSVYVGSDLVTLGLLSTRMLPHGNKTAQAWATANFFFSGDTLAQGDLEKIYAVMDPWIIPEGPKAASAPIPAAAAATSSPAPNPAAAPAPAPVPQSASPVAATPPPVAAVSTASPVELKQGMSYQDVVNTLGKPIDDVAFAEHRWLTYPGITITLEQGKLTAADRNERALIPVKISSDPGGADVLLDGSFVTSTPGVLRLQPGTYKIVVKKAGYADWERDLRVLPGAEINVNAALSR